MTDQLAALNRDTGGKATSSEYGDRGDGTSRWYHWSRNADVGAKADAAVTNPATAATLIAYIKGLLTGTGAVADAAVTNPASSASVIAALKGILTRTSSTVTGIGDIADAAVTGTGSGSIIGILKGLLSLRKTEDLAAASGDPGIMALTVRSNTPASTSGTDGDYQPQITDTLGATWVHAIQSSVVQGQDSAGLTTASTNYTSGDQVGTALTFTNMANVSGQGGIIIGATILDKALKLQTGDFEIRLYTKAVTAAADNAAADFSDADQAFYVGTIKWLTADWKIFASNADNQQTGLSIGYNCDTTSLVGYLVTRQANAFFTAATDVRVTLRVLRD